MNKSTSEIPVIDIENIDYIWGFVDRTNIQEEEYSERADIILERIQDKSRRQENPKEKGGSCATTWNPCSTKSFGFREHIEDDQLLKWSARLQQRRDNTSPATYEQSGQLPLHGRLNVR